MARLQGGRNPLLARNLGRLSKNQLAKKKGLHKRERKPTEKPAAKAAEPTTKEVEVGGAKNGGKRTVQIKRGPAFYPAEDARRPKTTRKSVRPASLRCALPFSAL